MEEKQMKKNKWVCVKCGNKVSCTLESTGKVAPMCCVETGEDIAWEQEPEGEN